MGYGFAYDGLNRLKDAQVLDPSTVTKITDYVGPYQYEDADGNATQVDKQLLQFQHAKGRATWDGSEFQYQYNLTDHARSFGVGALKVSCKSRLPRRRQRWKSQS